MVRKCQLGPVLAVAAALAAACGGGGLPRDAGDPGWVNCAESMQCPKDLPTCDPMAGVCVGCLSGNGCGIGTMCDETKHLCVAVDPNAPCHSNADCPRGNVDPPTKIVCQTTTGLCVQCVTNTDCVSGACDDAGPAPTFMCLGAW
jgi:hypothetical protein